MEPDLGLWGAIGLMVAVLTLVFTIRAGIDLQKIRKRLRA
jgi:hypothetical protein